MGSQLSDHPMQNTHWQLPVAAEPHQWHLGLFWLATPTPSVSCASVTGFKFEFVWINVAFDREEAVCCTTQETPESWCWVAQVFQLVLSGNQEETFTAWSTLYKTTMNQSLLSDPNCPLMSFVLCPRQWMLLLHKMYRLVEDWEESVI